MDAKRTLLITGPAAFLTTLEAALKGNALFTVVEQAPPAPVDPAQALLEQLAALIKGGSTTKAPVQGTKVATGALGFEGPKGMPKDIAPPVEGATIQLSKAGTSVWAMDPSHPKLRWMATAHKAEPEGGVALLALGVKPAQAMTIKPWAWRCNVASPGMGKGYLHLDRRDAILEALEDGTLDVA